MALSAFFFPQIGLKPKIDLCRRLSIVLKAGVDMRTAWTREAQRSRGLLRRHLTHIAADVQRGESLTAALKGTGDYFPPLLHELVGVGEETGNLEAVLGQLADHYEAQLTMRRIFLRAILWPALEAAAAIIFVGVVIWLLPLFRGMSGDPTFDIFGFGLAGNSGVAIYALFWVAVAVVIWLILRAIRHGVTWAKPIQYAVLKIPKVGSCLQTLALARLAWSLHLTMNTSIPIRRGLAMSLRSTQNAYYIDQIREINEQIAAGSTMYEAFSRTGRYPVEFLDTLAVGEESGQVVETMERLARQYTEQSRMAMATLSAVAGGLVYALVACILIYMIFSMFQRVYGGVSSIR